MTLFGSTVAATYRADGLRASKSSGSGTTYFLYDGGEPIVELNSSGSVTALNVFAPDGLVARTAGETTTEYVFDQQGNVADRTDTSGTIQSITQYDGWGNEQIISGTDTDPFGYNAQSGYYLDRETGLYLCQHRFYDPANGRWLSRDPVGHAGGTNLYGYVRGHPELRSDPSGHDTYSYVFQSPLNFDIPGFDCGCGFQINFDDNGVSFTGQGNGGFGAGFGAQSPFQLGYSPDNITPGNFSGVYVSTFAGIWGGTAQRTQDSEGNWSWGYTTGPAGGIGAAAGVVGGHNSCVTTWQELGVPTSNQGWASGWMNFGYH